jgi:hypothetical protein
MGHGSHLTRPPHPRVFELLPRQQDTIVRITASLNSQLTATRRRAFLATFDSLLGRTLAASSTQHGRLTCQEG